MLNFSLFVRGVKGVNSFNSCLVFLLRILYSGVID